LLIIDGRHMLYRTADVFRELEVEVDGQVVPTGAIWGFLNLMLLIHERWGGLVAVAWEGEGNFRFQLYPEYKQKGVPTEELREFLDGMNQQEVILKRLLQLLGVRQYEGDGCEADDVIGHLVERFQGMNRVVYSGDSDLRQLVGEGVVVVAPGGKKGDKVYDVAAVIERHGVAPEYIPDLKALCGDTSDNIPGVRGVGPKKAAALVQIYGNVDSVIAAAERSDPGWPRAVGEKLRCAVVEAAADIRLYLQLTTIKRGYTIKPIHPEPDKKATIQMLKRLKFASLLTFTRLAQMKAMAG